MALIFTRRDWYRTAEHLAELLRLTNTHRGHGPLLRRWSADLCTRETP